LAAAQARRDEFARDMRYLRHCMAQGVSDDEPPAQPRPRTTPADLARAIYSDEFDAYRERYARWEQNLMWPFVRKGK
jgi:hypothetical protein